MTKDEYEQTIAMLLDRSKLASKSIGEAMLHCAGKPLHRRMVGLMIKRAFLCSGATMSADGDAIVEKFLRGEELGSNDPGQVEVGMVTATWAALGSDADYALLLADIIAMIHAEYHKPTEATT